MVFTYIYTARTEEKTMTWAITWIDMVSLPTTPAPTAPVTKAQVSPALIGGSIGAVVLVIIIVIVVACVCWRQKEGKLQPYFYIAYMARLIYHHCVLLDRFCT